MCFLLYTVQHKSQIIFDTKNLLYIYVTIFTFIYRFNVHNINVYMYTIIVNFVL